MSELAYDPHPVAAAIARRSSDRIEDMLAERMGRPDPSYPVHEIPVVDHALSPLEEVEQGFMCGTSNSANVIPAALQQAETSSDNQDIPVNETWNEPGSSNKATGGGGGGGARR